MIFQAPVMLHKAEDPERQPGHRDESGDWPGRWRIRTGP